MPGDLVLVHGKDVYGRIIQIGQNFRYRNSPYAYWTHAAIIVDSQGGLIEANSSGIGYKNISNYRYNIYKIINTNASLEDREEIVTYLKSCIGTKYDWLTILSVGLSMLTGLRYNFGVDEEYICSGLAAKALERTKAIFPRDCGHMTPADLAAYYNVQPN